MKGVCYRGAALSDHISESAAAAPVTETLLLPVNPTLAVFSSNPSHSQTVKDTAVSRDISEVTGD